MTLLSLLTLTIVMISLALLPSTSVALVVTRSATAGVRQGTWAAAGIVAGDLLFVLIALLGMSALAHTLGPLFVAIKYLAAAYLILFGLTLLRSGTQQTRASNPSVIKLPVMKKGPGAASFLAGLLVTLGDVKAIFFYASLFPALVDVAALQALDMAILLLVTLLAVGGVKLGYALAAQRMAALARNLPMAHRARPLAGYVLLGAGGYLLAKS